LAGLVIITLAFYPGKGDSGPVASNYSLHFLAAAIQFTICITVTILQKKNRLRERIVNTLVITSLVFVLLICCYLLVARHAQSVAERFLIFFIAFQIMYVYDFCVVIATNLFLMLFFFLYEGRYAGNIEYWQFDVVNVLCACVIAATFTWISSHRVLSEMTSIRSLEIERNRFHEESIHDQLTGLGNRRHFEQSVDFYTSVCRHVHQTVCVIMLDVDFFKAYNDQYGHHKGDEVLKKIGQVLKNLSESEHTFTARVGGEEFIVLWTENRIAEAKRVARKLRQNIISLRIPHEKSGVAPHVTTSIGLYIMRGGSEDTSEDLYQKADAALYRAKGMGRDCIVLHDSADGQFQKVPASDTPHPGRENDRR
jgi:diguanylate cyclase (GGDEF)-like protein